MPATVSDRKLYFVFLCTFIRNTACSVPYNDVKADYETLLSANRMSDSLDIADVVPRDLSAGPLTIYLGIGLYAIMDYDGVSGRIQLVASMKMEWLDEVKTITGTTFKESLQSLFVGYNQIWTPDLVLMSAVDSVERIGDETYKVRFNVSTGYCKWYPRMIINAACTPDMTYYPFDKQTCTLTVTPWNLDSDTVRLEALTNKWNTDNIEESGIWGISETSSEAYVGTSGNITRYNVDFKITIKRKPLFLVLVIVLPVLLLSLLTGFLFLLPPGSGERVGFGITCFLSFVVLLQTLMSFMPEVSSPMSVLCFYVIIMVAFSVLLSIANVFLLRMHLNPSKEKLPRVFLVTIEIISCKIWRRCPKCPKINFKCPKILANLRCLKKEHSGDYTEGNLNDGVKLYNFRRKDVVHNTRFSKNMAVFIEATGSESTNSTQNDSGFFIGDEGDGDIDDEISSVQTSGYHSSGKKSFQFVRSASFCVDRTNVITDDGGTTTSMDLSPVAPPGLDLYLPKYEGIRAESRIRSASQVQKPSSPLSEDEMTWEYLAQLLDLFFIVVFCIVQTVFTIFYLVPLGAQY